MRTSRLWAGALALALFNALTPASAMAATEGEFVRVYPDDPRGPTYRIVGGAPMYLGSWEAIGASSSQPVRDISQAEFNTFPAVPKDGAVANDGKVHYRYAGGAPIAITNWDHLGGPLTSIRIDPQAITQAGSATAAGGKFQQLRQQPADGTFIVGRLPGDAEDSSAFVIAGGAPIYVSAWANVGGPKPSTPVDMVAIHNAGNGEDRYSHLNYYPADGTQINDGTTCYTVTAGVANPQGPGTCGTLVDPAAITNAGQSGRWSHLKAAPTVEPPPVESPPAVEAPVIQRTIKLTPIKKQSKLKIDVGPDSATADYECIVQIRKNRKWRTVLLVMTAGPRDLTKINLPRGKYRVQLAGIGTTPGVTSASVKLRR